VEVQIAYDTSAAAPAWQGRREQGPRIKNREAFAHLKQHLSDRLDSLALAPWFLRAICSIPSFGIAKFTVNLCALGYQQKCQQNGRPQSAFACVFNAPRKFS
jgi:hypothetical protein